MIAVEFVRYYCDCKMLLVELPKKFWSRNPLAYTCAACGLTHVIRLPREAEPPQQRRADDKSATGS